MDLLILHVADVIVRLIDVWKEVRYASSARGLIWETQRKQGFFFFFAISKYLVLQRNKADWQAWELTHFPGTHYCKRQSSRN